MHIFVVGNIHYNAVNVMDEISSKIKKDILKI